MENIAKADPMIQVAERTIGIEESGDENGVFLEEGHDIVMPPESHRIYRRKVLEHPGSGGPPPNYVDFNANYLEFGRWKQNEYLQWIKTDHLVKM